MTDLRGPDEFVAVIDEADGICYLFANTGAATRWAQGEDVRPLAQLDATSDQFKQMMAEAEA
ncbi:hypothetical protein [Aeromicrobium sp. 179-A 4D2 NHS]|uniref:hypothetical protein n=1 Tax=Aeromicrobium sp. 179-A 4D2 NHS TaxID=3142375 RepID=UPI0039A1C743